MINYHPNWFNSITFDNGAEFSTLAKIRERNLKKINDPVRNLKGRKKTQIVDQIRVEQETLPKSNRYKVGDILKTIGVKKATYHDERKRIKNYVDKYEDVKIEILKIAESGRYRGRLTYGYRRVQEELIKLDIHLSDAVVRRLMDELNVQVSLYNRHRNGRYSSYKGTVGKVARNVLHQYFNETVPFKVLHTDVTQVRLADTKWAYVSAITDEASKEVLAFQVSNSPNSKLIMDTHDELTENIPEGIKPIIHSELANKLCWIKLILDNLKRDTHIERPFLNYPNNSLCVPMPAKKTVLPVGT